MTPRAAPRPAGWLLFLIGVGGACSEPPCPPTWGVALDQPGGALLAGWGRGDDDAWLVGGNLGGGPARVVRWTGQARDVAGELGIDRSETLWWVWGSPGGELWMVGEQGLVLRGRSDGSGGFATVALPAATTATLYGVWGSGDDDVWIVGGIADAAADPDDDLVLHWDGRGLVRVDLPRRGAALFKVWGAGPGQPLWISGEAGTLWQRAGDQWIDQSLATASSILTVHGCSAAEVYAVGGRHVWSWDGAGWSEVGGLPSFALAAGVACGPREVLVVGAQGLRLIGDRATGTWSDQSLEPFMATDFHGAWAAPGGDALAVGGDYLLPAAPRRGVIAERTCR